MATQPKNWTLHGIMLTEPEPAAPGHKRMTKDWWLVQGEKTVLQKEEGFNIDVGDNLMFFFLRPKKEGLHEGKALIRIKFRRHVGREHRDESPLSAEDTAKLKYGVISDSWNATNVTGFGGTPRKGKYYLDADGNYVYANHRAWRAGGGYRVVNDGDYSFTVDFHEITEGEKYYLDPTLRINP